MVSAGAEEGRGERAYDGQRVVLEDLLLILPLVGDEERDGSSVVRDEERLASRCAEGTGVEEDLDTWRREERRAR